MGPVLGLGSRDCFNNSSGAAEVNCMDSWSPLWNTVVESSLWEEPPYVRVLFMTMLAIKDADFIVRSDEFRLHKKANISQEEVVKALKILTAPDRKRLIPQEFEGRRLEKVEGGWLILNGKKYREKMQKIKRSVYQANWQAEYRVINEEAEKAAWEELKAKLPTMPPDQVQEALEEFKKKYRKRLREERKQKEAQNDFKKRDPNAPKGALPGEHAYVKASTNGAPQATLDGITDKFHDAVLGERAAFEKEMADLDVDLGADTPAAKSGLL